MDNVHKNLKQFTNGLDSLEVLAIEILTKVMIWVTPIMAGVLIYMSLVDLDYPPAVAFLIAFVLEALGLAFMNTSVSYFYKWQGQVSPLINFVGSVVCSMGYFATAIMIALVVKLFPAWAVVVPGLAVVLSALSAVVGGIRSNTQKSDLLSESAKPRRTRKKRANDSPSDSLNVRPDEQTTAQRLANLERANAQRGGTPADYARAAHLKAEGLTWAEVAGSMGVSESTAKRYAEKAPQLNGVGGHHD